MGTWLVRGGIINTPTGDVTLLGAPADAAVIAASGSPQAGTAQLPIADTAGAFIYLDGAGSPVAVAGLPDGFAPDDAFTMHHITEMSGTASVEIAFSGLLDETFTAPPDFGDTPPFYTNTPLTGMTLAKLSALVGSHALLTMSAGSGLLDGAAEQSLAVYDADNSFNLNGTYTTVTPPPTTVTIRPSTGPVAGGTLVTIAGSGFNTATAVTFDGLPAAFTVVSDTVITATSPAHAVGAVSVVVVGPGLSGTFTYALVSTFGKLSPIPRLR